MGFIRMINIVIADDEERICKLIQVLGKWDEFGMQVVGTASNGVEALQIISRVKVDVLVTDIRMPGCDGLELVEKVQKITPGIKIIVISGYTLFEYAQKALKYGVTDYLIKPINEEALNESLSKIKEQLEEEWQKDSDYEIIRREHDDNISKLRSALLADLLANPDRVITQKILKEQYHFQVEEGSVYLAFCGKIDYEKEPPADFDNHMIWEKLCMMLKNKVGKVCNDYVYTIQDEYFFGVINCRKKAIDGIKNELKDFVKRIDCQKELFGSALISMSIGITVSLAEELIKSVLSAKNTIYERMLLGTGKLLEVDLTMQILSEKGFLDRFTRNISNALESLSVMVAESAVKELQGDVMSVDNAHGVEMVEIVKQAGYMFIMRLNVQDKNKIINDFYRECDDCYHREMLFEKLRRLLVEQMNTILSEREEDSLRPIRLAKQYIQENYSEQITLEEVSERVGLTSSYFSGLFKKETEVGFAKYLVNIRMEAAKDLLRESNLPVADICRKVGYNDIKHFTHNFEKSTGLKPTVFRKLYG